MKIVRKSGYETFTKLIDRLRGIEKPPNDYFNEELNLPKEENKEENKEDDSEMDMSEVQNNNNEESNHPFLDIIDQNSEEFKNMQDNFRAFQTTCYPLVSAITSLTSKVLRENLAEIKE